MKVPLFISSVACASAEGSIEYRPNAHYTSWNLPVLLDRYVVYGLYHVCKNVFFL